MNKAFWENRGGAVFHVGRRVVLFAGIIVVLALGAWLRFDGLGDKPMHHDEAEQAFTLGKLLEGGSYRYTKEDHHGPTLYYMSAWLLRATGHNSLAELNAADVRTLPAVFGVLLAGVPLLWVARRRVRRREAEIPGEQGCGRDERGVSLAAVFVAVVLGATSPTTVYYSRYFVQEMIFAACFWGAVPLFWMAVRDAARPEVSAALSTRWRVSALAAAAGVLFGMAIASKETWVLMVAAVSGGTAAVLGAEWMGRRRQGSSPAYASAPLCEWRRILAVVAVFASVTLVVAAAFFSSFGSNPAGLLDSVLTYGVYFDRAFESPHNKPFFWYGEMFAGAYRYGNVRFVLEGGAFVGALLLVPLLFVRRLWSRTERSVGVFSLVSGVVLFLIYSALRYKTPWLVPGMLPPLWMATGLMFVGLGRLALRVRRVPVRVALLGGLCALAVMIGVAQEKSAALLTSANFSSHERNPLAYVHSTRDVRNIEELAHRFAPFAPATRDPVYVFVFSREYGTLLWVFRAWKAGWSFDQGGRVWLATAPSKEIFPAGLPDPPVVITDDFSEPLVAPRLKAKYAQTTEVLRPGFALQVRVREDLVEKAIRAESAVTDGRDNERDNGKK